MRLILQENVANLGEVGDQVKVKPGFGRNFLIPYGKAVIANAENLAEFEKRRAELEKKAAEILKSAEARAAKFKDYTLKISAQATDEGKLFGSIGPREIATHVTDEGMELCKSEISLPEGPIRQTGEYEVLISLHSDVHEKIVVLVEREGGES